MSETINFQTIIMNLQEFWADYGCLIWQPYYTQVGAGTFNPATFLRALGPEPWNVAYVEPSIRPDDGRYGENPNRMQMHYQFQVILKPDPGNPQEIYFRSLEALGIDPRRHDIRFVEDNWESPALGAWGLGWEVWLDGQEITQFTYFQQAGGIMLDPVSVELTYGLERIAIALQRVNSFRDIQWSPSLTDGDVNLQSEQEHSKYYFEVADVSRLRQMFDLFEAEAEACLAQDLVLPAHDYVLKCSHTFNVLDTRGAVGVTERQAFFARMRDLSRRVAEAYLDGRQRLGYPWLELEGGISAASQKEGMPSGTSTSGSPAPLLMEIGTEELPVEDLERALSTLHKQMPELLDANRLAHGEVRIMGTPRRLIVHIEALAPAQTDMEQIVKGPPAERAFEADGTPTKAGQGFARSKGVDVSDLEVRELDGGRYAVAVVHQAGRPAPEVLSGVLPGMISSLRFDKSMRWNSSGVAFSRPIRWLLAIFGEGKASQVVPFEYAGIQSGDITHGLRFLKPEVFKVASPEAYFEVLRGQGIILDVEERRTEIQRQVAELASGVGGMIHEDPALLAEVANLVEVPAALIGSFDASHLQLPREVLTSVMKKHQRYFPVYDAANPSALLPHFIAVRNGDGEWMDVVRQGNEHVIQARFTDAGFFVREDMKKPLEAYLPRLNTMTFQAELGSMLDKTRRVMALVEDIIRMVGLGEEEAEVTRRAAEFCKADLATQMVVEMTSLQGLMGRYYAIKSGESQEVGQAIFEHYLPRFSGDRIPQSLPGLVVGISDRLDSLVGLFAAGLAPSGNKDPFALRRAALGLVGNLTAWELDFDLRPALDSAARHLSIPVGEECLAAVQDFIIDRFRNMLLDDGLRYDVVDAVLADQGHNPSRASEAVADMSNWVSRPDWDTILPAYARCVRITRDLDTRYPVDEGAFVEDAARDLYAALKKAEGQPRSTGSVNDFLNAFTPMIPAIDRFFDEVLVMTEEEHLRRNRLGLLQRIVVLADGVADMSKLEGF